MSFEQRKRVSIGTELAANPSILFLDEPTTGLDSRAAQALVGNIRKVVSTGRTVVCTIHQPSSSIFHSFDSLLLLKSGGQTVYFGELGHYARNLINYFEGIPNVSPMPHQVNPATWMLDVIGAGTSAQTSSDTDFGAYYNDSPICQTNLEKLATLTIPLKTSRKLEEEDVVDNGGYNASYGTQLRLLYKRTLTTYWRTPSYTISRLITNIFIALIFASAYPLQDYSNYVETVSRAAVIYITSLFCGILAMMMAIPIISAERPVFYHEQQSRMYMPLIFSLVQSTVEVIMCCSL